VCFAEEKITKNPDGTFTKITTRTIEIIQEIPSLADIEKELTELNDIEAKRAVIMEKANSATSKEEWEAFTEQAKRMENRNRIEQLEKWKLEVKDIK
jgi:hypothetical protein